MHISQPPQPGAAAASLDEATGHTLLKLRAQRKKKRMVIAGVVAVLAVGAGVATLRMTAPPIVQAVTLKAQPTERVLAVTGRVKPRENVQIFSRVAGQIVELNKDEGDLVQAGDVLGMIDPARAQASLAQATASVEAQRRVLNQAERDLERARTLLERGSSTVAAVEAASLAVSKGREDLRRLEAGRQEAQLQLQERSIIAPLTGRILNRPIDPGQVVNSQTALFDIAPTSAQEVEAEVDETYSMSLKLGQDARLAFAGIPEPIPGKLSYLSPEIQTSTGGRLVRFAFAAPESVSGNELPVGLSVDVNVIVDRADSAISIPREAIRDAANVPHVLTVKDGKIERQDISFIDWPAASVIVTSGVKDNDQVVLGQKVLPPGSSVRVAE